MLTFYRHDSDKCIPTVYQTVPETLPEETLWIDLYKPGSEDEKAVEKLLGLEVPTQDEMKEIELSSRLYTEPGALVMTLPIVARSSSGRPENAAVTFLLTKRCLVTVRYEDPQAVGLFIQRLVREPGLASSSEEVFVGLLEQVADRLADILEGATAELESLSHEVFSPETHGGDTDYFRKALLRLGRVANLSSKAKESLLNFNRTLVFFFAHLGQNPEISARIETLVKDIRSIDEHVTFLSAKQEFLLDATLGLINIDQNNIIKIFSVAAVAFLPPTLIASIYGMNFSGIPELQWSYGYPIAIIMMILSALIPMAYFRHKKWF